MTWTIVRIGWLRLRSNPLDLVLTFVVPVIFFSIFALIFGKGIGSGQTAAVKVLFVDEDETDSSRQFLKRLRDDPGFADVATSQALAPDRISGEADITREVAKAAVRDGKAKAAVVVLADFRETLWFGNPDAQVLLLADSSDEVAVQLAKATIQRALGAERGAILQEKARGRAKLLSENAQKRFESLMNKPEADTVDGAIVVEDLLASGKANPRISMYAAGIAVLFVLFSGTSAGATLLEEKESGTLERLLTSQLSVTQLLTGKWCFIAAVGFVQLTLMFTWAQLLFGVEFVSHLPGFVVMAIPTVGASASLAVMLATICRSRTQLNGVAMIIVLTMSALGGSMVPRYIMSDELRQFGRVTFNAWALDGFEKVFWRDAPVNALWPEILVLSASSAIMFALARVFARRWCVG